MRLFIRNIEVFYWKCVIGLTFCLALLVIGQIVLMPKIIHAQSQTQDGVNIHLDVISCNNNGICEAPNENWPVCPLDCTDPTATTSTSTLPTGGNNAAIAPQSGGGFIGPFPVRGYPQGSLFISYGNAPAHTSATIVWNTRVPTLGVVQFGQSSDLELGVFGETSYISTHHITLTDLNPDTFYYVRIVVRTIDGAFEESPFMRFKTLKDGDNFLLEDLGRQLDVGEREVRTDLGIILTRDARSGPPTRIVGENFSDMQLVSNEARFFSAIRNHRNGDVNISWLPPQGEYRYVRIVRKSNSFPKDARDGDVVYEGRGDSTTDEYDISAFGYYGIFVRKQDGLYSDGVFAKVAPRPIIQYVYMTKKGQNSYRTLCEDEATLIRSEVVLKSQNLNGKERSLDDDFCTARLAPWYWMEDFRPTTIYYWIRCVLWKRMGISW